MNFIWLKKMHTKRVRGALGLDMIVPWVTYGGKPVLNGQYRREGQERAGSQGPIGISERTSALKGTWGTHVFYSVTDS